ncbi:hypothetical protein DFQ27_008360 [Actinomortierella ambigua]|uniref:Uncharacterized protein n=1 Tax=Actinomortierella ambigua TaxID=1343610 RepID=A0A9P6QJ58_9FUNG|nr:hypothetical protein DFQ27_008360 [Actinomortierella ambigua]
MNPMEQAVDDILEDLLSAMSAQMSLEDTTTPTIISSHATAPVTELGISAAIQGAIDWLRHMPLSRPGHLQYLWTEQLEYYLGFLEKTEYSSLIVQTAIGTTIAMVLLFFLARSLFPSLRARKQGLAWTLTFCMAVALFSLSLVAQVRRYKTPLFEWMGWSRVAREAGHESILTHRIEPLTAILAQWTQNLVDKADDALTAATVSSSSPSSLKTAAWLIGSLQRLAFQVVAELTDVVRATLKAPLSPPLINSYVDALPTSSFLSWIKDRTHESQQGLVSMEHFPHQDRATAVGIGLFLGYSIANVALGRLYYTEYLGVFSGYLYHIFYSVVALRLAVIGRPDLFLATFGPMELPTIFLSLGYMFPRLWSGILSGTLYLAVRIVFHGAILHECLFNHRVPLTAGIALSVSLLAHCYWWLKFILQPRQLSRPEWNTTRKTEEDQQSQDAVPGDDDKGRSTSVQPRPTAASSGSQGKFSLRTKSQRNEKAKAKAKA